jgi:hypothetical protein
MQRLKSISSISMVSFSHTVSDPNRDLFRKFIDFVFTDGFVKCIVEDDLIVHPECHGYRIFLQPLVSVRPYIFKLIISLFFSSYNIDNIPIIPYRIFLS